jgi:acetoin utilization deacetylase AcuC-like enzyme
MLRIYTHDDCLAHAVPEGHPERSARLAFLLQHLEQTGFASDYPIQVAPQIENASIARAHDAGLIRRLCEQIPETGLASVDPDTWVSPQSMVAARSAAGAVWQGVQDVTTGDAGRVFCAVRPPGHHAESGSPMGFCLLNSVAIAAVNALTLPEVERVAILDFDVHHGNGTVEICRSHPEILVCSSFQSPFYPGRYDDLTQSNIVNTPLEAGSSGDDFRRAIAGSWWKAIELHRPDIILISAGFDAHRADPLAQLNLDESDFYWITREIAALANEFSRGRIVSTLEGGYDLQALADSALVHLRALAEG